MILDWFYDTPIGQEIAKINKREVVLDNINEHRRKAVAKRIAARIKRKKKNKSLKRKK